MAEMTAPTKPSSPKKKSAITRACDNCRYRKIKCDGQMPCARCIRMQFTCAYDRPQKKKGPCGKRIGELRRMQLQQQQQQQQHEKGLQHRDSASLSSCQQSQALVRTVNASSALNRIVTNPYELFPELLPTVPPQIPGLVPQHWPTYISEASLIPHIETFFERLYSTLPVLNRTRLLDQISQHEHRRNPHFGSMLLAMSAFSLIQPLKSNECDLYETQQAKAKTLMAEAVKMRNDPDLGDNPSLDLTLASFFLFACLYGTQKNNAAWFRLQEAVTLGAMMGLGDPATYANLNQEEVERRLRTFWVLSVTERAYALQRRHPITFRGHPAETMQLMRRITDASGASYIEDIVKESTSMLGLKYMVYLFNSIDENIIECWNLRCGDGSSGCRRLTEERVVSVHHAIVNAYNFDNDSPTMHAFGISTDRVTLKESQQADAYITQQWLRNRLWQLSLSHNLLKENVPHPELRMDFALTIARSTLSICHKLTSGNKRMDALESHGIGLVEKLYDIASSVAGLLTLFPYMNTAPNMDAHESFTIDYFGEITMRESLNHFLNIFAAFRGGQHPYFDPFVQVLSSLPAAAIAPVVVKEPQLLRTNSVESVHGIHTVNAPGNSNMWQPRIMTSMAPATLQQTYAIPMTASVIPNLGY